MTNGIAISYDGIDIRKASDYQRTIDTRWKTMNIVKSVKYVNNDLQMGPQIQKIVDHNLGYLPAFDAPYFNGRYEVQSTISGSYTFVADTKSIYLVKYFNTSTPSANPYRVNGYINIYDLNIEENYESVTKGLQGATGNATNGVKIIGNGDFAAKTVGDQGAYKFSITSEGKAFGIQKVGTAEITNAVGLPSPANGSTEIPNDLPYPPLIKFVVLGMPGARDPNTGGPLLTPPSSDPKLCSPMSFSGIRNFFVRSSGGRVTVESSENGKFKYIIFRDPIERVG